MAHFDAPFLYGLLSSQLVQEGLFVFQFRGGLFEFDFDFSDEFALFQERVGMVGMVSRAAYAATDPLLQILPQLHDILAFAEGIGVFQFLALPLKSGRFRFQFGYLRFQGIIMMAHAHDFLAFLVYAVVSFRNLFPQPRGVRQHFLFAFQVLVRRETVCSAFRLVRAVS